MKINSVVGSYLDPLADKVKSLSSIICFLLVAHCGCSLNFKLVLSCKHV